MKRALPLLAPLRASRQICRLHLIVADFYVVIAIWASAAIAIARMFSIINEDLTTARKVTNK